MLTRHLTQCLASFAGLHRSVVDALVWHLGEQNILSGRANESPRTHPHDQCKAALNVRSSPENQQGIVGVEIARGRQIPRCSVPQAVHQTSPTPQPIPSHLIPALTL